MRFGSVCSGIEAASVAWHPLGWSAAWLAEIEPFPSAVLAHHYPSTPNLGDMTTIAPRVLAGEVEAPDVLVGGTPCQAFSVAGLRRSLDDDRGNLALSFVHLADAVDSIRAARGEAPAWILWENVPGVLSTHDNAFGCLLAGLVRADAPIVPPGGKWKGAGVVAGPSRVAAWRILDAQHFGVAQRRRRVFVLARGGARAWSAADALLPVTESVRWHPAPSREARASSPAGPAGGAGVGGVSGPLGAHSSGGWDPGDFERNGALIPDVARTLRSQEQCSHAEDLETFVPQTAPALSASVGHHGRSSPRGDGTDLLIPGGIPDVAWCLQERDAKGADSDTKPGHLIPVAFDTTQITHPKNRCNPAPGDPCHPLAAAAAAPAIAFSSKDYGGDAGELAPTLRAEHHDKTWANGGVPPAIAFEPFVFANTGGDTALGLGRPGVPPLTRRNGDPGSVVAPGMSVRRLLPTECEALQGFPRNYTLIPWKKGEAPDGPRYRALGNSMAVPVMAHIGRAIQREEDRRE